MVNTGVATELPRVDGRRANARRRGGETRGGGALEHEPCRKQFCAAEPRWHADRGAGQPPTAKAKGMPVMDNELFRYSPIPERPPINWPGGARVAFYLGLNIEHYQVDRPSTSIFGGTAMLTPDPLNYGWRDYGPRVGIWRLIESLDRHGVRASVLLNSDVCSRYPQIIPAGQERGWAWLAHGRDNSTFQAGMSREEEAAYLTEIVTTIEAATGRRPQGWLGPALTETFETPSLLAELGLGYTLDWTNDDQPYELEVPGVLSVPYSIEMNDV